MLSDVPTRGSNLAGSQGVFRPISSNPNKDGRLQGNSHKVSELAFSDSSSAPAGLLPFSDFAGAMTHEMTLAANVSGVPLIENVRR
jgi:hypothetical protein